MFPLNHSVYGTHSCGNMLHVVLEFLGAVEIHVSVYS